MFICRYNAGGVWKLPLNEITGINETVNSSNIYIYPNPSKKIIKIVSDEISENSFISIYDINGKKIISQKIDNNNIDISSLPTGIYLLKLYNDEQILTTRLIKN